MTSAVVIVIDGKPVAKGRPRMTKAGIAFTPSATRKFEAHGRMAAQMAMGERPPIDGPVIMTVEAVLPIPKSWPKAKAAAAMAGTVRPVTRPDTDNYAKGALDACNEIVFRDDSQVVELVARKVYGDDPRLVVTVTEWTGGLAA